MKTAKRSKTSAGARPKDSNTLTSGFSNAAEIRTATRVIRNARTHQEIVKAIQQLQSELRIRYLASIG